MLLESFNQESGKTLPTTAGTQIYRFSAACEVAPARAGKPGEGTQRIQHGLPSWHSLGLARSEPSNDGASQIEEFAG